MALLSTLDSIPDRLAYLRDRLRIVSADHQIEEFDLRLQLGLHLPRLWEEGAFGVESLEELEANRLARRIAEARHNLQWLLQPPTVPFTARDLQLVRLSDEEVGRIAVPILERLHYLRSFRSDSDHFAVASGDRPVALATISRFDLPHILSALSCGGEELTIAGAVCVLSRVYVFRWAPKNTISMLLGRVQAYIRAHAPATRLLLTYVNPNLGFSGSSYRASGWRLAVREQGIGYAYLDGDYITYRALVKLTGARTLDEQRQALRTRTLVISRFPLQPLQVYARTIHRHDRLDIPSAIPLVAEQICS